MSFKRLLIFLVFSYPAPANLDILPKRYHAISYALIHLNKIMLRHVLSGLHISKDPLKLIHVVF